MSIQKRNSILRSFTEENHFKVLLLTISVGGLGLNLTAADSVVFLEHDWNPQVDLQAMDRAHRIGQKKNLNVFRLIAKDSIEDRIIALQRGKLDTARKVVDNKNSSIWSMNTESVMELFENAMISATAERQSKEDNDLEDEDEVEREYEEFG